MASNAISSAAASLWMQNSQSHDGAAATMHTQQTDVTGAATAQDHGNALVVLEEDNTSGSNGYVDYFMGGFGPRHLAEVTVVPESAGARAHGSRNHANKADAAAAAVEASSSSETATAAAAALPTRRAGGDDGAVARRPVITKARRIRLASAASQAAEVLQSVGSPATALLLSQRVQQLQAEEALLNASLQRLKAERDLATVRHTCGEELDNYRRGVQQREQQVVRAAMTAGTRSQDPVVSYSQESGGSAGGDTLQTVVEADLLGMPATADAEAAAAAAKKAAAAGKAVQKSGRASHAAATVISAKKRLRYGATAAGGHKANASPKSLSRRPAAPAASKSKRPSLAKQTALKARAGKQPAAVCKDAVKAKPKAPLRMKATTPAFAAATAKAAARRQKAKVKAAATKPSRKLTKKPTKPRTTTKAKSVRARPAAKATPSARKTAAKKRPTYEKRPTRR
ncbi:hypothetical protein CGC20_8070 [Leishmania donovani]|nr:hypothetical protein CGC20_8070 [Leishmania donovani]